MHKMHKTSKTHHYIAAFIVIVAAWILVFRIISYVRRVVLLKHPKTQPKPEIDMSHGILRGIVNFVGDKAQQGQGKKPALGGK